MDQSPPPQDTARFLIDEASDLIGWLIGEIADLLSLHICPERKMWRSILNHFILPAEAALRRVVHLIAASLPAPEPGKAPPPRKPKRGAKAEKTEVPARAPSFRLTEPLPRPKTDYLPINKCPRIRFVDEPTRREPLRPARAPFDLALYDAQLRRRIAALEAAWANPVRIARRLQRLLARAQNSAQTRPRENPRLRRPADQRCRPRGPQTAQRSRPRPQAQTPRQQLTPARKLKLRPRKAPRLSGRWCCLAGPHLPLLRNGPLLSRRERGWDPAASATPPLSHSWERRDPRRRCRK